MAPRSPLSWPVRAGRLARLSLSFEPGISSRVMAEEAQGARPAVLTRFEEELESCDCDSVLVAGREHCPGVGYAIEYGIG